MLRSAFREKTLNMNKGAAVPVFARCEGRFKGELSYIPPAEADHPKRPPMPPPLPRPPPPHPPHVILSYRAASLCIGKRHKRGT